MTSSSTVVPLRQPDEVDDPLTAVLRAGARRLLAQAIEAEADAFLALMKGERLRGRTGRRSTLRRPSTCYAGGTLAGFAQPEPGPAVLPG